MSEFVPASRVSRIKSSASVAAAARVRELKAEGRRILDLTVGEPDFDTPDHIKSAAVEAINRGETKYTSVTGTPALQAAILQTLELRTGIRYSPAEITIGGGAKHAKGDLRIEEVPLAAPAPDEAVVEVRYGGICGSDLHYWLHGAAGESVLKASLVLGHEISGRVVRAAADGTGPGAGTAVAVHPATPGPGAARGIRRTGPTSRPAARTWAVLPGSRTPTAPSAGT